MTTWLITGCSTGLGRAFADAALQRGHNVAVTARDVANVQDLADAYPDSALALALDVTDDDQVAAAVSASAKPSSTSVSPERSTAVRLDAMMWRV